jgi:hypothetical protein
MVARLLERGKTSGRSDDNEATIRKRLATFRQARARGGDHAVPQPQVRHGAAAAGAPRPGRHHRPRLLTGCAALANGLLPCAGQAEVQAGAYLLPTRGRPVERAQLHTTACDPWFQMGAPVCACAGHHARRRALRGGEALRARLRRAGTGRRVRRGGRPCPCLIPLRHGRHAAPARYCRGAAADSGCNSAAGAHTPMPCCQAARPESCATSYAGKHRTCCKVHCVLLHLMRALLWVAALATPQLPASECLPGALGL